MLKQDLQKRSSSVDQLRGDVASLHPQGTNSTACNTVTTIDGKKGPMQGVVRPSSLNYKISLLEAVRNYISKEKLQADQYWDVDIEESNSRAPAKTANFELLDDALFNLLPLPKSSTANFWKGGSTTNNSAVANVTLAKNKRDSSTQL